MLLHVKKNFFDRLLSWDSSYKSEKCFLCIRISIWKCVALIESFLQSKRKRTENELKKNSKIKTVYLLNFINDSNVLLWKSVKINGVSIDTEIDSDATYNIIRKKIADKLFSHKFNLVKSHINLQSYEVLFNCIR